jgi:ATP-dependent Clp protease ATP-binding subunit ClpB
VKLEIEKFERVFDLNKAAELKYSALPPLEQELERIENMEDFDSGDGERMLRDEVVADDIAAVVAIWTGVPPQKLMETERDRILNMADKIKERVVGQDNAVQVVTDAVQRSRAGLSDPNKPIASFMFLGPTVRTKLLTSRKICEFFCSNNFVLSSPNRELVKRNFVKLWRNLCLTQMMV